MNRVSTKSQNHIPIIAKESLALAGLALLYPFGMKWNRKRSPKNLVGPKQKVTDRTIVLVHGLMANRSCFLPLESYLKLHGIKNIVHFEYQSRNGVEAAARKLAQFVKTHAQSRHLCFVGHSLGGVVAQTYIQLLGGHRKTERLISIGSPHQGTYNAYWLTSKIGQHLRPDSSLYKRLGKSMGNVKHVPFFSVAGERDNIILPRQSAQQWETRTIAGTGHLGLLWSPSMMNLVLRLIQDDISTFKKEAI